MTLNGTHQRTQPDQAGTPAQPELWYASFEPLDQWGSGLATYCRNVIKAAEQAGRPIRIFVVPSEADTVAERATGVVSHVYVPQKMDGVLEPLGYWMHLSWRFAEAICAEIDRVGPPASIEFPDGFALAYFLLQRKLVGEPRLKNIPIMVCAHTPVGVIEGWNGGDVHALPNWWTFRAETWCCKAADGIITMSSMMEGLMRERGYIEDSQRVFRSSYPFITATPALPAPGPRDRLRIGMASRMIDWKGLREALSLARTARKTGRPITLELCGETTPDFERAKRRFADVFADGDAVYLGKLTGDELRLKRATWDCQIHPSPFDNFPFSVVEAYAAGLPCLISGGNGIAEVLTGRLHDLLVCDFNKPEDVLGRLALLSEARALLRDAGAPALDAEGYFARRDSFIAELRGGARPGAQFPFVQSDQAKSGLRPASPIAAVPNGARLSVVVPYYNLGRYIDPCIESILDSTVPTDVIIVNDGSTEEGSIRALDRYRAHGSVRVLDIPNQGVAGARNSGVRAASTEFVALLDADDTVAPTYYAKALHVLDHYDNVGFVGCWANDFEDGSGKTLRYWPTYNAEPLPNIVSNNTNCQALVYRRDLYLEAGQHDPSLRMFLDDWDGMLGMLEQGYFGVMLPEPLFNYRQRPDSVFRSNGDLWKSNYDRIVHKRRALVGRNAAEALLFSNSNGPNSTYHLLGWQTPAAAMAVEHASQRSPFKKQLVKLWDSLPKPVQKRVEPIADFIDRITR